VLARTDEVKKEMWETIVGLQQNLNKSRLYGGGNNR